MTHEAKLLIDGEWLAGPATTTIFNKFTGAPATVLHVASADEVSRAVAVVADAQRSADWTAYDRYQALSKASRLLEERRDQLVESIVIDAGFTRADANGEISRAAQTLLLSAEAAKQLVGEMIPLESAPGVRNRLGFTRRFPIGVVAAITPFNSPLNTVCHKLGPALAAGNGVVLKPAQATPLTANVLGQVLLDSGVPSGLLAIVHGSGSVVGEALLADPRVGFYTFTGSTEVGKRLHAAAGLRPTQLELGSIATTIVCDDADIEKVVPKIVAAGFRKAGQVCTSVQRLYVENGIVDELSAAIEADLATRIVGDPEQDGTLVGPLISRGDAERVEGWITAAVEAGAKLVAGGSRTGSVVAPTILAEVTAEMDVFRKEVFGPVVSLLPFDNLDRAIEDANSTDYGLAAGIFTRDISRGLHAAQNLRFGGVHINETSSSRLDLMPYGGVKESGHGREGPLYAAREMTEERLITISYG